MLRLLFFETGHYKARKRNEKYWRPSWLINTGLFWSVEGVPETVGRDGTLEQAHLESRPR